MSMDKKTQPKIEGRVGGIGEGKSGDGRDGGQEGEGKGGEGEEGGGARVRGNQAAILELRTR